MSLINDLPARIREKDGSICPHKKGNLFTRVLNTTTVTLEKIDLTKKHERHFPLNIILFSFRREKILLGDNVANGDQAPRIHNISFLSYRKVNEEVKEIQGLFYFSVK